MAGRHADARWAGLWLLGPLNSFFLFALMVFLLYIGLVGPASVHAWSSCQLWAMQLGLPWLTALVSAIGCLEQVAFNSQQALPDFCMRTILMGLAWGFFTLAASWVGVVFFRASTEQLGTLGGRLV